MNWRKATTRPKIGESVWILSHIAPEHGGGLLLRKGTFEGWYDGKGGWCVTPSGGGTMLPGRDFFAWVYDEECDLPKKWCAEAEKPAVPPRHLVWWLTQSDYMKMGYDEEGFNPIIPKYIKRLLRERYARSGRCRLWGRTEDGVNGLGIDESDPRWNAINRDAGGLVINAADGPACAKLGGLITTLTLEKWNP